MSTAIDFADRLGALLAWFAAIGFVVAALYSWRRFKR